MTCEWERRWELLKDHIDKEKEGIPEQDSESKLLTNIRDKMYDLELISVP